MGNAGRGIDFIRNQVHLSITLVMQECRWKSRNMGWILIAKCSVTYYNPGGAGV